MLHAEQSSQGQPAPRIEHWESTISNFEALDAKNPKVAGGALLIGGSNARRWTDVDDHFPKHPFINRGFGGARLTEILHFADRIVLPHAPKLILVNAGGNDLNAGSTPEQVRETAGALIAYVQDKLPDAEMYFIGLPYVGRAHGNPQAIALIDEFNKKLRELAAEHDHVGFIHIVDAYIDEKGGFKKDLFVKDGTHFNDKGYEVLAELIRNEIQP